MALSDMKGFFQNHTLRFVESKQENERVYSFWFEAETPFSWKAGQHGGFKVNKKLKPFTVGSPETEGRILLTTEIDTEKSDYKKALLALQPGDTIVLNGPVSSFYVTDPGKQNVFLAEGIGVIPFRAMLKGLLEQNVSLSSFHLLYQDREGEHLFCDVWEDAAAKGAHIHMVSSGANFDSKLEGLVGTAGINAEYFVSGKPAPVKHTLELLKSKQVMNIHKDVYNGYKD